MTSRRCSIRTDRATRESFGAMMRCGRRERPRRLEIVSVITSQSARRLKLKVWQKAYAIIKSDSVIVGTN